MSAITSKRPRRTNSPTVETYTLVLIHNDGSQTPVGKVGPDRVLPFHYFNDWTEAADALADVVLRTGGSDNVHALTVTVTQSRDGKLLLLSLRKYDRDEVANICFGDMSARKPPSPQSKESKI